MNHFDLSEYCNSLDMLKLKKQFQTLDQKIELLEDIQQHQYKNKKIAALSLIHASSLVYWPENKVGIFSNEKLEYLGDSFLNYCISRYSMSCFPHLNEGDLSKLRAQVVSESNLASKARTLRLGECLLFGKTHKNFSYLNQDSIMADSFESITAALLLDSGHKKSSSWLFELFREEIELYSKQIPTADVKGAVQHWAQLKTGQLPIYHTKDCTLDVTTPEFEVSLSINQKIMATARAKSKKEASHLVAKQVFEMIKSGQLK